MYDVKCCECGSELKIMGTGTYGDTIMVECQNDECCAAYEVEPDGLGDAGFELWDAMEIDRENN